eukprot:CAMPEP_0198152934 /NCGR_PEP_ID=MMETSP1443-20131203/61761_1 /TAXON_ID=186043 /ORGANISM="Entomoneis sp., Strain CCMP2396" /LENGTH=87 /DNA_ID=CAMNT_0043819087 /DNA_START=1 /DNA_END=264 /DNA_ORIENTATION=+
MKKHFKTRFPEANVHRRNEAVATGTLYSDTPSVDNGAASAQLFVGRDTLISDAYGIESEKEFVNTLEDQIRSDAEELWINSSATEPR